MLLLLGFASDTKTCHRPGIKPFWIDIITTCFAAAVCTIFNLLETAIDFRDEFPFPISNAQQKILIGFNIGEIAKIALPDLTLGEFFTDGDTNFFQEILFPISEFFLKVF